MKTRIISILALLFGLGTLVWTACDKVQDGEMRELQQVVPAFDSSKEYPIIDSIKYVVLEDFTGVRCVNCPKAAVIAHTLQAQYKSQLILVELHPSKSGLTNPYTGDSNLRSDIAQTYYETWNSPALPAGLVSRRQTNTLDKDEWGEAVAAVAAEKPVATVDSVQARLAGTTISVEASGYFREDYEATDAINMIVMVLEDGFKVRQEGDEESKEQHNYAHNHVLRTAIDGAWGVEVLAAGAKTAGTEFQRTCTTELEAAWNAEKLWVVVLLTNAETREILNAAKVKVKK